ncbi:hypothetical protein PAXINDRAFT_101114 [Paxillus involutus ATCC 200175]|uniref:Unplaced genomic scaffold PAXINscaffold_39, whole genome shotgun sequence n=1 Tax=Paxillus involutus ATCC 200175 TaxID=664439 RepID=A0A0C9TQ57_PAXIN|nr:hypothetical protein PAXINDRAFT_101114 [Paxillus involutus ATCC 200175]
MTLCKSVCTSRIVGRRPPSCPRPPLSSIILSASPPLVHRPASPSSLVSYRMSYCFSVTGEAVDDTGNDRVEAQRSKELADMVDSADWHAKCCHLGMVTLPDQPLRRWVWSASFGPERMLKETFEILKTSRSFSKILPLDDEGHAQSSMYCDALKRHDLQNGAKIEDIPLLDDEDVD